MFEPPHNSLIIGEKTFQSRLILGTGKFSSIEIMNMAIAASGTEMVTVALRRLDVNNPGDDLTSSLKRDDLVLLPNTSGARDAEEAVHLARLARAALGVNWLKLEIHPDPLYLLPDPIETLKAAEILVKEGFLIMPYINADPVLAKRLEEVGTVSVMPLGAPIGSNRGLETVEMLRIIVEQAQIPVIVDAGIGAPSHAALAMEIGADAVLVNTAIAVAGDPIALAQAFRQAVIAGRIAYEAGLPGKISTAQPTSPLTSWLNTDSEHA